MLAGKIFELRIFRIIHQASNRYISNSLKNQDVFKILGIPRNCTRNEAKVAYFKLAKQFHPDVNPDPASREKFEQIKSAYEFILQNKDQIGLHILNEEEIDDMDDESEYYVDSIKKDDYYSHKITNFWGDTQESDHLKHQFAKDLFNQFDDHFNFKIHKTGKNNQQNCHIELAVNLKEAIFGTKKNINFNRNIVCTHCKGNRTQSGRTPLKCFECGGIGRNGAEIFSLQCKKCKGLGYLVEKEFQCKLCNATGIISVDEKIETKNYHQGNGMNVAFLILQGNYSHSGYAGDLIISTIIIPHPKFQRIGNDIYSKIRLSIVQATLGCQLKVETIFGEELLKISPGIQNNEILILHEKGMKTFETVGDHFFEIFIYIPKEITEAQKKLLLEFEELNICKNQLHQEGDQNFSSHSELSFRNIIYKLKNSLLSKKK